MYAIQFFLVYSEHFYLPKKQVRTHYSHFSFSAPSRPLQESIFCLYELAFLDIS